MRGGAKQPRQRQRESQPVRAVALAGVVAQPEPGADVTGPVGQVEPDRERAAAGGQVGGERLPEPADRAAAVRQRRGRAAKPMSELIRLSPAG